MIPAKKQGFQIWLESHGQLKSSKEIESLLKFKESLNGFIQILFRGAMIRKGQVLAKIDTVDFVLRIQEAKAALAEAEARYLQEMGQQKIARKEFELLGQNQEPGDIDKQLALRGPQLASAKAAVARSKALVQQAKLSLKRASIRAEFSGVIRQKM